MTFRLTFRVDKQITKIPYLWHFYRNKGYDSYSNLSDYYITLPEGGCDYEPHI